MTTPASPASAGTMAKAAEQVGAALAGANFSKIVIGIQGIDAQFENAMIQSVVTPNRAAVATLHRDPSKANAGFHRCSSSASQSRTVSESKPTAALQHHLPDPRQKRKVREARQVCFTHIH